MSIVAKILDFIESSKNNNDGNEIFIDIGKLSSKEINNIKKLTGVDFSGYSHSIDQSGIKHVLKKHPNINASDILLIPFIIKNYDFIGLGTKENTIVYKKIISDEMFYVEEIRTVRKKFVLKTLYKRKIKKAGNKFPT